MEYEDIPQVGRLLGEFLQKNGIKCKVITKEK